MLLRNASGDSVSEIGLMEFMRPDHGAVLARAGVEGQLKNVRHLIGNPVIMQSMTRIVPDAGLLCARDGAD